MQVTIQKRGNQPARVTVKQGQKLWKTTEAELDMLPAPSRGYVARALGKPANRALGGFLMPGASPQARRVEFRIGEDGKPQITPSPGAKAPAVKLLPDGIRIEIREEDEHEGQAPAKPRLQWHELKRPEPAQGGAEHRLHELQEQVQQLRRELDKLRKSE